MNPKPFLSAEWRALLMVNYVVDPALLAAHVPAGTELDLWRGEAIVSMVGFRFLDTRVLGVAFPFHRNFDEVNLRLYVRRRVGEEWRRGVVFIKEIVPRWAIASVARWIYGERYVALPMRHRVPRDMGAGSSLQYEWRAAGRWHSLSARAEGAAEPLAAGSEEEFIFEHYWGYARKRSGAVVEYEVRHPAWRAWQARDARLECDIAAQYGAGFVTALSGEPRSSFIAEGSRVEVMPGRIIS